MRKILLTLLFAVVAVTARAQFGRGELRVAYGVAPVTSWVDSYSDLLSKIKGEDASVSGWGAVSVGYQLRIIGGLGIGIDAVYASNRQKDKAAGHQSIDSRYWSVMPNLKWRWLNLKVISFYSRAGVGATFTKAEAGGEWEKSTKMAFQVSPLGVEVGGRLAAFAEAGVGSAGCLLVGARLRF